MADEIARAHVRQQVDPDLSDEQADALLAVHDALARGMAGVPFVELKQVQPPLQSMPGPAQS